MAIWKLGSKNQGRKKVVAQKEKPKRKTKLVKKSKEPKTTQRKSKNPKTAEEGNENNNEEYTVLLENSINKKRASIQDKQKLLPSLRKVLGEYELNNASDQLNATNRESKVLHEKIESQIRILESGEELKRFELDIEPYMACVHYASNENVGNEQKISMKQVYEEYNSEINGEPKPIASVDLDCCAQCGIQMTIHPIQSYLICPQCKTCISYLEATSSSIAYGDEVEHNLFLYKKANHLREWLDKVQGKCSLIVTKEQLKMLSEHLYNKGFRDPEKIQKVHIKDAIKEIRITQPSFKRFSDHYIYIHYLVTNVPRVQLSPTQESVCKFLFKSILGPFEKVKERVEPGRTNFISYGYCLHRFCVLMNYGELPLCFPILKCEVKLEKTRLIFDGIMEELKWAVDPKTGRFIDAVGP